MWIGIAALLGGGGYYYYSTQGGEDAHAKRKAEEEKMKAKAQEAVDAGKQTAHHAVKEGQQQFDQFKV